MFSTKDIRVVKILCEEWIYLVSISHKLSYKFFLYSFIHEKLIIPSVSCQFHIRFVRSNCKIYILTNVNYNSIILKIDNTLEWVSALSWYL